MSLDELKFLSDMRMIEGLQAEELRRKMDSLRSTSIGRKLKLGGKTQIADIKPTSYDFYAEFFHNKISDALMFPLDQYEECMTTGTLGIPKRFLMSKAFIMDAMRTFRAILMAASLKEGKTTFQRGDTFYLNAAPKPFVTGVLADYVARETASFVKVVPPDQSRPFHEKVQYFIDHHKEIYYALMPLVMLFHQVYPKIKQTLDLKGFFPFDTAAEAHMKRIREIVNCRVSGVYASTETCLSTIPSAEHELGFVFDPRSMYCEFLPMNQTKPDTSSITENIEPKDLVSMSGVKKGVRYLLFITPFKSELMRYNTGDILEVVDHGDSFIGTELPVFKFFSRAAKVISLVNFTTINESELLLALTRSQIPYVDFTARLEIEDSKHYLALYLEPANEVVDKNELEQNIHQSLGALDPDYANVNKFYQYSPLKLTIIPKGSFSRLLATKQGFPKVDRINMAEKDLSILLSS